MRPFQIVRLETAARRPTTTTTWRIAKALRPRGTLHDQVAVDERLRVAAGASLRDYSRRPHAARERVRAELLAEAAGALVVTEADTSSTPSSCSPRDNPGCPPRPDQLRALFL
ncbi:MAG: hypothetical protein LC799_33240 [Actinobacteria bacterium]|nr:hypothetical protein [Actinomycetota bacterium]